MRPPSKHTETASKKSCSARQPGQVSVIRETIEVMDLPLVSIVTPSYNAAGFLEETIQSVLSQDYPRIEYIVMDGGSTDGTLDILRKYEGRLQYRSQPDRGQTDAINKGFKLSRGDVFAFLCADDTYLPGAIGTAVRHLQANPGHAGIYGEAYLTDESGKILCRYPTREFDPELLKNECFICQPASFLRRDAFLEAGMMDVNLHLGLDYDFWIPVVASTSGSPDNTSSRRSIAQIFVEELAMVEISNAAVNWDEQKKQWVIRLQIGGEVIKRAAPKAARETDDELLRSTAVQIAEDEGYHLNPSAVTVTR
jgi:glycosyltransferase involved in cell wall biosynthesis